RGYSDRKVEENVQCEIFQTIYEEAMESYRAEIVHQLPSNNPDDLERNLLQIQAWLQKRWANSNK
uniref:Uncharacterized protein n=1 Tax=Petromyzon marinus TaxID=7757 RepID=S4RD49_PETMA